MGSPYGIALSGRGCQPNLKSDGKALLFAENRSMIVTMSQADLAVASRLVFLNLASAHLFGFTDLPEKTKRRNLLAFY